MSLASVSGNTSAKVPTADLSQKETKPAETKDNSVPQNTTTDKAAQDHANDRKSESMLDGIIQQAKLQGSKLINFANENPEALKMNCGVNGGVGMPSSSGTPEPKADYSNGARAKEAREKIDALPDPNKQLTSDVKDTLTKGVEEPRTNTDRGEKGFLGINQAKDAAETITKMNPEDQKRTQAVLDEAGKNPDASSAQAQKALILKAVAARKDKLESTDPKTRDEALKQVETFGKDIKGMNRDELARKTTPYDIDNHDANKDGVADNDGLQQRYGNTCAPTTAQMMEAEADPVKALALNKGDLSRDPNNATDGAGKEQADRMTKAGDKPLTQKEFEDGVSNREAVNETANKLEANKHVIKNKEDRALLKRYANGESLSEDDVNKVKEIAGKVDQLGKSNNAPSWLSNQYSKNLEDARNFSLKGRGMASVDAYNKKSDDATQAGYNPKDFTGDTAAMDKKLRDGHSVPISVQFEDGSSHAMLINDVRDGKYLVSDPFSGKTAWVKKEGLTDGTGFKAFDSKDTRPEKDREKTGDFSTSYDKAKMVRYSEPVTKAEAQDALDDIKKRRSATFDSDNAVRERINPGVLFYAPDTEKKEMLKTLRTGYTTDEDKQAMRTILQSARNQSEFDQLALETSDYIPEDEKRAMRERLPA